VLFVARSVSKWDEDIVRNQLSLSKLSHDVAVVSVRALVFCDHKRACSHSFVSFIEDVAKVTAYMVCFLRMAWTKSMREKAWRSHKRGTRAT
jgi:hypothetical protein